MGIHRAVPDTLAAVQAIPKEVATSSVFEAINEVGCSNFLAVYCLVPSGNLVRGGAREEAALGTLWGHPARSSAGRRQSPPRRLPACFWHVRKGHGSTT